MAIYGQQLFGRDGDADFQCSGGIEYTGPEHRFSPGAAEKRKQAAQLGFQGRDDNGLYDVSVK
ncbi:hypothetical protein [Parageobacillus genomosp. 1]|uniref:hypothetical protein n=1 Tax=Parageobacillus genomosp. 1 TaxID=1295642 RepID=UPI0016418F88|nr:hypothetical protein [Parageobacillus genomosp. 1]